jgi:hypothetical protein
MKEIKITKDSLTEYWIVSIDNAPSMKSKTLEKLAKNLYKWAKGQGL